jgi:Ca2+-binding RTX toxin-like protein
VAQGVTATALAGPTDPNTLVTTYSTTAIQTLANSATVGDINGAQLGTLGDDNLIGDATNNSIDGLDGRDHISGLGGNDFLYGGAGKDFLTGGAGNDLLDGGTDFDRAIYTDATGSITVNLAAGTVSGAGVGTDTLVAIEGVIGSDYNDTFDATGFTGLTGVPGAIVGFNEFEGGKGDDHIIGLRNISGQALTRVSYLGASDSVTVDIQAGTADGTVPGDVAAIGHDTFSNVVGVIGSAYDDILRGSNNAFGSFETYEGRGGNDFIDGRGGYDIVGYANDPATTAGITVHLADGTVIGDATVGTDTLRAVEAVRGTNFDDLFDATGFGGANATNIGSFGTFNDFQGAGGNDRVIGNGFTRVNYANAGGAVVVDLQTNATGNAITVGGTASGLGEGTDTLTGVNAAQGSSFGDTLLGSDFNNVLTGLSGDDFINGRGGFDTASYNSLTTATTGVNVHLAAGTATGLSDGSIGNDTLRSIEGIQGTVFVDHFDATGYGNGQPTTLNVGNNGTFNQFEGLAGDDVITGNGNTRIAYFNATAGVIVAFTGTGTGTADGDSSVGHDTFTMVNSVTGSGFADTIGGDGNSNTMTGGGGNDAIDGGGGADLALFTGVRSDYTISLNTPAAGQTTVTDSVAGRDGTDTLINMEIVQFSDSQVLIASGSAVSPIDVSDNRLFFGAASNPLTTLSGSSSNDFLKIGFSLSGHLIDLGAGADDTVSLGPIGSYTLKLANVEHVVGSGGNDIVTLSNTANGLTVDLGGGTDNLNLANGLNSLSVANVENVFGGSNNDTIVIGNTAGSTTTTVTGGLGADIMTASAAPDNFRFTSTADSQTGNGDQITSFDAANDKFVFHLTGPNGFTGPINFVGSNAFDGSPGAPHSEARFDAGSGLLQIDVNGDGVMDTNDIEVHLTNLTGALTNSNFILA